MLVTMYYFFFIHLQMHLFVCHVSLQHYFWHFQEMHTINTPMHIEAMFKIQINIFKIPYILHGVLYIPIHLIISTSPLLHSSLLENKIALILIKKGNACMELYNAHLGQCRDGQGLKFWLELLLILPHLPSSSKHYYNLQGFSLMISLKVQFIFWWKKWSIGDIKHDTIGGVLLNHTFITLGPYMLTCATWIITLVTQNKMQRTLIKPFFELHVHQIMYFFVSP